MIPLFVLALPSCKPDEGNQQVTSVSCDPVNRASAASSSEDRTIKTWNLARGHVAETIMYTSKCHRFVNLQLLAGFVGPFNLQGKKGTLCQGDIYSNSIYQGFSWKWSFGKKLILLVPPYCLVGEKYHHLTVGKGITT